MTEDDVRRIEQALEITLPAAYRASVIPFPLPALVGSSEDEVWDDAQAIIALNQELRSGAPVSKPWPAHMFALGQDDAGCQIAIDLRDEKSHVWWVDRSHLDRAQPGKETLESWLGNWVSAWKDGQHDDSFDPMGTPADRVTAGKRSVRSEVLLMVVMALVGTAVVVAIWLIRGT